MKNILQNLRQKPKSARVVIAVILTIIIVAPVFLIWFFSLSNNLEGTFSIDKNRAGQVQAEDNKESLRSFVSIGSALKSAAGNFWSSVSAILTKPSFETQNEEQKLSDDERGEEENFEEEIQEINKLQPEEEL